VICETAGGYVICEGGEGMLSVKLVNIAYDWVWRSGSIDNMLEVGLGWFHKLVLKKQRIR
jgi:hypothetical protein